jgi:ribosome-binding protein aMBF1 (putative translation factor)
MKNTIPAELVFAEWRKDPQYVAAYDALEEEFALASQIIGARARAGLSQAELAERMNTSQSAIARLEGGRSRPSTRTLRKLAEATGSKLRIVLEPADDGKRAA